MGVGPFKGKPTEKSDETANVLPYSLEKLRPRLLFDESHYETVENFLDRNHFNLYLNTKRRNRNAAERSRKTGRGGPSGRGSFLGLRRSKPRARVYKGARGSEDESPKRRSRSGDDSPRRSRRRSPGGGFSRGRGPRSYGGPRDRERQGSGDRRRSPGESSRGRRRSFDDPRDRKTRYTRERRPRPGPRERDGPRGGESRRSFEENRKKYWREPPNKKPRSPKRCMTFDPLTGVKHTKVIRKDRKKKKKSKKKSEDEYESGKDESSMSMTKSEIDRVYEPIDQDELWEKTFRKMKNPVDDDQMLAAIKARDKAAWLNERAGKNKKRLEGKPEEESKSEADDTDAYFEDDEFKQEEYIENFFEKKDKGEDEKGYFTVTGKGGQKVKVTDQEWEGFLKKHVHIENKEESEKTADETMSEEKPGGETEEDQQEVPVERTPEYMENKWKDFVALVEQTIGGPSGLPLQLPEEEDEEDIEDTELPQPPQPTKTEEAFKEETELPKPPQPTKTEEDVKEVTELPKPPQPTKTEETVKEETVKEETTEHSPEEPSPMEPKAEDSEKPEPPKDNTFLKENWTLFLSMVEQCTGVYPNFPEVLPENEDDDEDEFIGEDPDPSQIPEDTVARPEESPAVEEKIEPPKQEVKEETPSTTVEEKIEPPKQEAKEETPSTTVEEKIEPPKQEVKEETPSTTVEEKIEPPKEEVKEKTPSTEPVSPNPYEGLNVKMTEELREYAIIDEAINGVLEPGQPQDPENPQLTSEELQETYGLTKAQFLDMWHIFLLIVGDQSIGGIPDLSDTLLEKQAAAKGIFIPRVQNKHNSLLRLKLKIIRASGLHKIPDPGPKDEYERKTRIVQKEWEKVEATFSEDPQKGFNEHIAETEEGRSLDEEELTPEYVDTCRTVLSLFDEPENFDIDKFRATLSPEELMALTPPGIPEKPEPKKVEEPSSVEPQKKAINSYAEQIEAIFKVDTETRHAMLAEEEKKAQWSASDGYEQNMKPDASGFSSPTTAASSSHPADFMNTGNSENFTSFTSARSTETPASFTTPRSAEPPASFTTLRSAEPPASFTTPRSAETPASFTSPGSAETPASFTIPRSAETPASFTTPRSAETPASFTSPGSAETPASFTTPRSAETPASFTTPRSTEFPASFTAPGSNETPTSSSNPEKGTKAKKMWDYFLSVMKDRHQEGLKKFLAENPAPENVGAVSQSFEQAKALWQRYAESSNKTPQPDQSQNKIQERPKETTFYKYELKPKETSFYNKGPSMTPPTRLPSGQNGDPMLSQSQRRVNEQATNAYSSQGWNRLTQELNAIRETGTNPTYNGPQRAYSEQTGNSNIFMDKKSQLYRSNARAQLGRDFLENSRRSWATPSEDLNSRNNLSPPFYQKPLGETRSNFSEHQYYPSPVSESKPASGNYERQTQDPWQASRQSSLPQGQHDWMRSNQEYQRRQSKPFTSPTYPTTFSEHRTPSDSSYQYSPEYSHQPPRQPSWTGPHQDAGYWPDQFKQPISGPLRPRPLGQPIQRPATSNEYPTSFRESRPTSSPSPQYYQTPFGETIQPTSSIPTHDYRSPGYNAPPPMENQEQNFRSIKMWKSGTRPFQHLQSTPSSRPQGESEWSRSRTTPNPNQPPIHSESFAAGREQNGVKNYEAYGYGTQAEDCYHFTDPGIPKWRQERTMPYRGPLDR